MSDKKELHFLSRRDFLGLGGLALGAVAAGPAVDWLKKLNFLPADTEPNGERFIENIIHAGPDILVDSQGSKYKITMNQNATATLFLKAAQIEGGTRLVNNCKQWLEANPIVVYTSPFEGFYSLFYYPELNPEKYFTNKNDLDYFQKKRPISIPTEIPPITKNENGIIVPTEGCVFPPTDTTNGKTAVCLSSGVVYSEFARSMCKSDPNFARTHPTESLVFETMRTPSYIPGHELWHVTRWVQDPVHEYQILHDQAQLAIYNEGVKAKQKTDTLTAIAAGVSSSVIDKGTTGERVAVGTLIGLGTKNALNQVHPMYPTDPHPEPNTSRINDAFDYDRGLQAVTADCFKFEKII